MFSADMLKLACEKLIILLTYLSKWVEKKTHDIITKYRVGCGYLTAIVAVTKKHLHWKNNWGSVQKVLSLVKWVWNTNELHKYNHKFGIKILIKLNTPNILKINRLLGQWPNAVSEAVCGGSQETWGPPWPPDLYISLHPSAVRTLRSWSACRPLHVHVGPPIVSA